MKNRSTDDGYNPRVIKESQMNDVKLPPLRRKMIKKIVDAAVAGDTRTLRALVRWYAAQAANEAREAQEAKHE